MPWDVPGGTGRAGAAVRQETLGGVGFGGTGGRTSPLDGTDGAETDGGDGTGGSALPSGSR
ncbi:hypothetical protein [Actinomadura fibrosa]|uniref:Uncharacterized protein n=1 Tax=Actinomadura fibrosa TaxID=111802 RepID=A0ABW2XL39_9ACTN|nr:hypothetical protein [Actinomadura fibrosa]